MYISYLFVCVRRSGRLIKVGLERGTWNLGVQDSRVLITN